MLVTNFSITLPLTQMQAFDTKLATWYFWYTQMPSTFPKLEVKAEQQDVVIYQVAMTTLTLSTIIKHVMSSASGAKLAATLLWLQGCRTTLNLT
jgi:hypothetical protein